MFDKSLCGDSLIYTGILISFSSIQFNRNCLRCSIIHFKGFEFFCICSTYGNCLGNGQ